MPGTTTTPPNQKGSLVRRLESYGRVHGLVVGPWADCSKDLPALVKVMGVTKVATRARERERQPSDNKWKVCHYQSEKFAMTKDSEIASS